MIVFGWVDSNPVEQIVKAINSKAEKFPRYRKCADLEDVRLLIVANRRMNSGKLSLQVTPGIGFAGIPSRVFFLLPPNLSECLSTGINTDYTAPSPFSGLTSTATSTVCSPPPRITPLTGLTSP